MASVPALAADTFRAAVIHATRDDGRIASLFGYPPDGTADRVRLVAVIARNQGLDLVSTEVGDRYQALTPDCPEAHWFEREIAEQWGAMPVGHPWLKPIRFHPPYTPGRDAWPSNGKERDWPSIEPGVADYFSMSGDEVHEVAVGPVHAGVIEPGHFRFQCHGEMVFHLEVSLGYQHRGIERQFTGGPHVRTVHHIETAAGDTAIAHAWAYSLAVEALSGVQAPPRAVALRGVALELERIANHIIDLGALAGDVGFLPTLNYCGRLRGDALNTTAAVCGSRMGRGWVRPGGVKYDLEQKLLDQSRRMIDAFMKDAAVAVDLLWDTPSVMARFEGTGPVSADTARALGLVGVAARASGLRRDARHEFPAAPYAGFTPDTAGTGDVYARAWVRWQDVKRSCQMLLAWLDGLPSGPAVADWQQRGAAVHRTDGTGHPLRLAPDAIAVALVEGWRGEVCHTVITNSAGRIARYKIVDPSFHNWQGLAVAMRDQAISDFPLCNKSFNLSYCGHDL
jgi:Ni,Fe-hydrogenase III large subunit